jgi:NADH-quinone oxidoreductase subunit H
VSCPSARRRPFFGLLDKPVPLYVADVPVAVLVIFAVASMGVYGIVLAGWSSNSKYSLLGGLRSSAQMISYELSYGMALAAVLVLANSLSLQETVNAQAGVLALVRHAGRASLVRFRAADRVLRLHDGRNRRDEPRTVRLPRGGAGARRRIPHRVLEHELSRSSFLAEYVNMVTVSAVATNLYLGGWHLQPLPEWLGIVWWFLKLSALLFFYLWLRWTLPRYRYDQLMQFGWKFLLPLSVVNLLVTAAGVLYFGL